MIAETNTQMAKYFCHGKKLAISGFTMSEALERQNTFISTDIQYLAPEGAMTDVFHCHQTTHSAREVPRQWQYVISNESRHEGKHFMYVCVLRCRTGHKQWSY